MVGSGKKKGLGVVTKESFFPTLFKSMGSIGLDRTLKHDKVPNSSFTNIGAGPTEGK